MNNSAAGPTIKRFCFINRKAPYGTIYAHEMLESVLVASAFEQDVSVVFIDDGVFQLKKEQDTSSIDVKNFSPTFRALEHYDIEKIYIERESMASRGLTQDDLIIEAEVLASEELSRIIDEQDVVLSA